MAAAAATTTTAATQQLEQQPSGEQYEGHSKTVDCLSLVPGGVSSKKCEGLYFYEVNSIT